MAFKIFKEFQFEAAHYLPLTPQGHKCHKLHGHSYKIKIHVGGTLNTVTGWVIDFADIKKAFTPILETLDHSCLNEIEGLSNPTAENLAVWIWDHLIKELPSLDKIEVQETASSGCIYTGNSN